MDDAKHLGDGDGPVGIYIGALAITPETRRRYQTAARIEADGRCGDEEKFGLFPGEPLALDGVCPGCRFVLVFAFNTADAAKACPRCDGTISNPYFERARDNAFFDDSDLIG